MHVCSKMLINLKLFFTNVPCTTKLQAKFQTIMRSNLSLETPDVALHRPGAAWGKGCNGPSMTQQIRLTAIRCSEIRPGLPLQHIGPVGALLWRRVVSAGGGEAGGPPGRCGTALR